MEANQVEDPDEIERRDDERRARETKVEQAILMAFTRIGLNVSENEFGKAILYDEDGREANVTLDDKIDLDVLLKLKQSGLSNKFTITAHNYEFQISFNVAPEIDHALLPQQPLRR